MIVPFFDWDEATSRQALAERTGKHYAINRDFLEGEHWRGGDGWKGPRPDIGDADYKTVMLLVEAGFVSRNVVEEISGRHTNGVAGKPPRWRFTTRRFLKPGEKLTDAEIADIALIESWLTDWWDRRETSAVLQKAILNSVVFDRGPIRLKIPEGLLTDRAGTPVVVVKKGDVLAALDYLWPEAPDPEWATVWRDEFTMRDIGIVVTNDNTNIQDRTGLESVHLCYLDGSKSKPEFTIIRKLSKNDEVGYVSLNLGGRLTTAEICRSRIITPQIIEEQMALNLALSMVPKTVVMAGFLERVILAGQMPGEYQDVKDQQGNKIGTKFVPAPPTFGPSYTNYVAPIAVDEDDGRGGTRTVMSSPDIKWHEPTDPAFAIKAKDAHYQDMLEEADQAHVLIQSDATPSGMSREQARSEYEGSLNKTKPHVDKVGRWFLETLLAFAEALAGIPGKYSNKYRAMFECNVDSGPLTPDEKRFILEAADRAYLSNQTAMEFIGVEDTDAELARIKSEGVGNIGQLLKKAEALKTLADAKFPISVAVKILQFPEEFQAEIVAEVEKAQALDQQNKLAEIQAKSKGPSANPPAAVV